MPFNLPPPAIEHDPLFRQVVGLQISQVPPQRLAGDFQRVIGADLSLPVLEITGKDLVDRRSSGWLGRATPRGKLA